MKYLFFLLAFTCFSFIASSQNCQYGQCIKIKSDGYQCKRCVSFGDYYCSSHQPTINDVSPQTPLYNEPQYYNAPQNQRDDCKYGQCVATKKDGSRCKRCTGSIYDSYCSSHK